MLQFFSGIVIKDDFIIYDFLVNYVSTQYNDHLDKFNRNIVEPALREFLVRFEDFIEDELEDNSDYDLAKIQIFSIGSISNNTGNIAIGENIKIKQVQDINNLSEEFFKEALNKGYSLKDIDILREDIDELKDLLKEMKPDVSKLSRIFRKVLAVGGNAMLSILVNLIARPEITSAIVASL